MMHTEISNISQKINTVQAIYDREHSALKRLELSRDNIEDSLSIYEEAASLCEACITQSLDVKEYIEQQVTILLQQVFGEAYSFHFEPVYAENGVSLKGLRPRIQEGDVIDDPKNHGDGIRNVVSFALRLTFLILNRHISKVIVLDEPLVNLNEEKWQYIVEFLNELQTYFDIQIIIITHARAEFPTLYEVSRPSKISLVRQV